MKLQGLGIIFAIVILPIAVILSFYIQMQVDTINLRTSYDSKVLDATYDAVAALELNTANEKLSDVSDSLRSILEASNNVFFNTLLTNFGLSNASPSLFQPYVPAILYTLYDGYYIYSPTESPDVLKYGDYENLEIHGTIEITIGNNVYKTGKLLPRPNFNTGVVYPTLDEQQANQDLVNINGQAVTDDAGQRYYKYSGTSAPGTDYIKVKDQNIYFVSDINKAGLKYDYLLKSYMPYAARYKWTHDSYKNEVVINYTLDNYLNIEGNVDDIYYTKTGYLIDPDSVQIIDTDAQVKIWTSDTEQEWQDVSTYYPATYGSGVNFKLTNYNEQDVEELIASGDYRNITVKIKIPERDDEDGNIVVDPTTKDVKYLSETVELKLNYEIGESLESFENDLALYLDHYHKAIAAERNSSYSDYGSSSDLLKNIIAVRSKIQIIKAIQYYVRNKIFSEWVYSNLNGIQEKNAEQVLTRDSVVQMQKENETFDKTGVELFRDISNSEEYVFGNKHQDVEINSTFINHKLSIIRNSIQYNLNLAFTNYTRRTKTYIYELPIMSNAEWNKIMSRVSMVAYFDGMPCGSKTYTNYAVVSSTNNEITVIPDELYYVPGISFCDSKTEAHRIDCDQLVSLPFTIDSDGDEDGSDKIDEEESGFTWDTSKSYCISFRSKDLKYDRVYNKSSGQTEYDYLNLMCYDCIVNNNTRFDHLNSTSSTEKHYGLDCAIDFKYLQEKLSSGTLKEKTLYREYIIAVGCQRQGLYKTNAMTKSEGYSSAGLNVITMEYDVSGEYPASDSPSQYFFASAKLDWNKIKGLEIVVGKVTSGDRNESNLIFDILQNNDNKYNLGRYTLYTNDRTDLKQTIIIDVDPNQFEGLTSKDIKLYFKRLARNSYASIKVYGVRIIYE